MSTEPGIRPAPWPAWCWSAIVIGAVPVAALLARFGLGVAATPLWPALPLLLLWALLEEVVFRGGVQPLLARTRLGAAAPRWGISAANAVTSVLFCAAHLAHRPAALAAGLLPVSLVLGASLERSGHLWVPVALHGYFNLLLFGASAWLRPA